MGKNRDFRFLRMGEACIVVEFGTAIDPELNERVHRLARLIQAARLQIPSDRYPISSAPLEFRNNRWQNGLVWDGILELVPTYRSLAVYYDPLRIGRTVLEEQIAALIQENAEIAVEKNTEIVMQEDLAMAQGIEGHPEEPSRDSRESRTPQLKRRTVVVPVCYGGGYGPDLEFVAKHAGLSEEEVVRIHTSRTYRVYMLGFLPGFPYLGGMDERIATPRLETPRTRIPAGSVGIAGSQTGFYPLESPGGWRIIGRTPLKAFDPFSDPPCLLSPGDSVQFKAIGEEEYRKLEESGDNL